MWTVPPGSPGKRYCRLLRPTGKVIVAPYQARENERSGAIGYVPGGYQRTGADRTRETLLTVMRKNHPSRNGVPRSKERTTRAPFR